MRTIVENPLKMLLSSLLMASVSVRAFGPDLWRLDDSVNRLRMVRSAEYLYDVISAYPLTAKRQIEWQALKMAMSVKGKNRHYLWSRIQPRHWLAMAKQCQFSEDLMQAIIEEICDKMEAVIGQVTETLPSPRRSLVAIPNDGGSHRGT